MIYLWIIFFGLLTIHSFIRYSRKGRLINKIPGPKGLPIIGNLLQIATSTDTKWVYVSSIVNKFYPIVKLWIGYTAVVAAHHPHDIKILLTSKTNITKSIAYRGFHRLAKTGLIISTGEFWNHRRKILNQAFKPNMIKIYNEHINKNIAKFIENLKVQGDENLLNLIPSLSTLVFNVICESAIGPGGLNTEDMEKFKILNNDVRKLSSYWATKPYIPNWITNFSNVGKWEKSIKRDLRYYCDKAIQKRKQYYKSIGFKHFQKFVDGETAKTPEFSENQMTMSMLDFLLLAQQEGAIDQEGFQDEILTIINAGFHTTTLTLAYTLMLLAENKEAQDLARLEAFKILDENKSKITLSELKECNYIECCVKESLRLFPSVPIISRCITSELQLENYTIPEGTMLGVSLFHLHRDLNYWTDPEKFDPDRFLPGNINNNHFYAYLPFSSGPRNCIGYKLATINLVSTVAQILYNFRLEPVDRTADLKFEADIILKSTESVYIKFVKLKKSK